MHLAGQGGHNLVSPDQSLFRLCIFANRHFQPLQDRARSLEGVCILLAESAPLFRFSNTNAQTDRVERFPHELAIQFSS